MALTPQMLADENRADFIGEEEILPSKTYEFNFDTGEFTGAMIDGAHALRQFIRKVLATRRFRYVIYTPQYGNELFDLLGQNVTQQYLESEAKRMITEALIYDDRIQGVSDFVFAKDKGKVYITFTVSTVEGVFEEEVVME